MIFLRALIAIILLLAAFAMPDLVIVPVIGGVVAALLFIGYQLLKWASEITIRMPWRTK